MNKAIRVYQQWKRDGAESDWRDLVTTSIEEHLIAVRHSAESPLSREARRVTQLHGEGLHLLQIAKKLNDEGFVPPRRRGVFTEAGIGSLVRDLGLVGELFRDDMLGKDEWWIPDLAGKLGVISQKIHYWVRQAWVHSRRIPSGKHLIVWADKDEIRRLKQLAKRKNSWITSRHPELIIPKACPGR